MFTLAEGVDSSILVVHRKSKSQAKKVFSNLNKVTYLNNSSKNKQTYTPNINHSSQLPLKPKVSPFVAAFSQPYLETIIHKKRSTPHLYLNTSICWALSES
jgi:hypothetical protein